ncbi:acetyl-CoA acetyltransferase [Spirillospora sp. CA-255316]
MAVFVLGGAQTDFARKWSSEVSLPLPAMMEEASLGAVQAADVSAAEVQTAHVANFVSESMTGQAHLGAIVPMLDPAWHRLPTARHEAACASGSVALLAAMAELEAGRYDVALVVGVEVMRNMPGPDAARRLGAAASVPTELRAGVLPWPDLFDQIAAAVDERYGLDAAHLRRIAEINRANARRNPLAQARDWSVDPARFAADERTNPIVAGRLRRSDCGLITDGAAAVVLASKRFTEGWKRRTKAKAGRASLIRGWGHHAAPLPLADKLRLGRDEPYLFPNVRQAIVDAYGRAEVDAAELDLVETHDCFTVNEYVALDHLGITGPGEGWKAIEDGRIEPDGAIPVNPSGGLIGAGHPVGATGVRMLLDAHRQVTGTAGDYQVPGARLAATLNIGGSCSTAVSFVVGADRQD